MGVATHRRFIDTNLAAACLLQRHQFLADNRQQRLGQRIAVFVTLIRHQPPAQRVGPGSTGLQRGYGLQVAG